MPRGPCKQACKSFASLQSLQNFQVLQAFARRAARSFASFCKEFCKLLQWILQAFARSFASFCKEFCKLLQALWAFSGMIFVQISSRMGRVQSHGQGLVAWAESSRTARVQSHGQGPVATHAQAVTSRTRLSQLFELFLFPDFGGWHVLHGAGCSLQNVPCSGLTTNAVIVVCWLL